ncbi:MULTISPECIES: nuclear transport factor 2 family protein [Cyanophyceae]|uniref:nuclear transport factor 2 family protein n=1 Tax=Cyanophyceae TaxID=3028117 RepID=UPI00168269DE|nr:nuclear transport factor 2 family protein [Trichocoleus sp. FACHB-69]MBD1931819.1 nuclear transport factor 2 family protein [Trichocoleus sp. FACHB-69]
MKNPLATVYCYIAAWNEREPSRRRELIRQAFAEDAVYVDPLSKAQGYDEIDKAIAGFFEMLPGTAFLVSDEIIRQNSILSYSWKLTAFDGSTLVEGSDRVQLAEDGRYRYAIGFYVADPVETSNKAKTAFEAYQN